MTELIDSDKMYRKLLETGEEWADRKSAYHALDDSTKTILADIMSGLTGTRTDKQDAAMRSKPYVDHLASVALAHKAYLRAEVRYKSLQTLVELRRSEESTRRAEMRL